MSAPPSSVTPSRLSDALRLRLTEKAWPQKKLAALLQRDESTVSLWVSGRQAPRVEDLEVVDRLARFLGTTADHVRGLVSAQKEPGAAPALVHQRVVEVESLRLLLRRNAFLRGLFDLKLSRTSAVGLRDRFFEEGYDVDLAVLERFVREESARPPAEAVGSKAVRARGARRASAAPSPPADFADGVAGREAVRQACRALNALFEGSGNMVPRETAEESAGRVCEPLLPPGLARQAASTIVARCGDLHLLRPLPGGLLLRRWPLSPEYVLNSLWGIRSGVRNFDFLLDGGWLPPSERGFTMLAKGKAGRGKTMFALQTAASIAAQGHFAVYLTAEETAAQLLARLSYAGFAPEAIAGGWQTIRTPGGDRFECFSSNDIEDSDAAFLARRAADTGRGYLFVVEVPQRRGLFRPNSRLLLNLESILDSAAARDKRALAVFDSLDALEPPWDRRALERVAAFARHHRAIGLLVSEVHDRRQPSLRDHLVDTVIRFDVRERIPGFTERVLEIEKCRTQSQIRGEHMFAIHGGSGITVYPSVQALLSVWRRRIRRPETAEGESWALPDLNFDEALRRDIVRGATMLLTGPPGTHRFLIGLGFLAAGLLQRPASHAILVTLREDPEAVYRIIANHPQLAGLLDPSRPGMLNPRLRVLHFPPDYFSAERFLHWLQKVFREYEKQGVEAGRILFSSIGQLLHNSPMFPLEKLFIDALLELFKRKRVTSLFLGSEMDRADDTANAFDVILFCGRDPAGRTTFRVAHSGPCNASESGYYVERERRAEGIWLRLQSAPAAE
jgi:KaiC/GvpD/RAD55 family RecA-like ATPase/transcriptional regulator with XRE-family HTH domain